VADEVNTTFEINTVGDEKRTYRAPEPLVYELRMMHDRYDRPYGAHWAVNRL